MLLLATTCFSTYYYLLQVRFYEATCAAVHAADSSVPCVVGPAPFYKVPVRLLPPLTCKRACHRPCRALLKGVTAQQFDGSTLLLRILLTAVTLMTPLARCGSSTPRWCCTTGTARRRALGGCSTVATLSLTVILTLTITLPLTRCPTSSTPSTSTSPGVSSPVQHHNSNPNPNPNPTLTLTLALTLTLP